MLWNYILLKFKYKMVEKLDYDLTTINDIEVFYDEVYNLYINKFKYDYLEEHKESEESEI